MALLSQNEIDALIEFLNQQKNSYKIKGEILSQDKINKLIQVIKTAGQLNKELPLHLNSPDSEYANLLLKLGISDSSSYSLDFSYDKEKGVSLYAFNPETEESFAITPSGLSNIPDIHPLWGACMAPTTFNYIASKLDLRYSEETFEKVTKHFASVMYGNENIKVPDFYLP